MLSHGGFRSGTHRPRHGVGSVFSRCRLSWLIDALNNAGANYAHAAGTTTTVLSTGFGELAEEGKGSQIEVRASWSPTNGELKSHLEAWSEFVCMLAGFPPSIDGVSAMPDTRPTP